MQLAPVPMSNPLGGLRSGAPGNACGSRDSSNSRTHAKYDTRAGRRGHRCWMGSCHSMPKSSNKLAFVKLRNAYGSFQLMVTLPEGSSPPSSPRSPGTDLVNSRNSAFFRASSARSGLYDVAPAQRAGESPPLSLSSSAGPQPQPSADADA